MPEIFTPSAASAVSVLAVNGESFAEWNREAPEHARNWVKASNFKAETGNLLLIPNGEGILDRVLVGASDPTDMWTYGDLPKRLGAGTFRIGNNLGADEATHAAVAWGLGCYDFNRYTGKPNEFATLVWPEQVDRDRARTTVEACGLVRDLINTPANDMGPDDLDRAARSLARTHGARVSVTAGDDLLYANYPTIHAVGRAAANAPKLIDLRWGDPAHPKLTLIGKGVCFDTGGLDIKPAGGMLRMKKDMGGAAHVLGLAHMVMAAGLPVRLRVLIPAVENSISGNAMRPLDIVRTRKGLTVEIGNTDAEGRLILCDALSAAMGERPDLVIDCATLTGAARVALGTELPALFANDDDAAGALVRAGRAVDDPTWRLPLHAPYDRMLESEAADLCNVSEGGMGGAITAALFLQRFVEPDIPWVHIDMMAWNVANRPGRPKGGEAQFIRGAMHMLMERYSADGKATPQITP